MDLSLANIRSRKTGPLMDADGPLMKNCFGPE